MTQEKGKILNQPNQRLTDELWKSLVIFCTFKIKRHISFISDPFLSSHQQVCYVETPDMPYPFCHWYKGGLMAVVSLLKKYYNARGCLLKP